ncbi:MAG: HAD superfamily hydrolase (TIGR01459 family) [Yoonia sp.]|jgi:HAD superfamily hydrolase (TIGR01459 family)
MVTLIESIGDIADHFDAIVLDQWGVLHDGSAPYPSALATLDGLCGRTLGVLSNSGKRAAPNTTRIASMGFDASQFHTVMTSGEALWQHFTASTQSSITVFPVEGKAGDAAVWARGLDVIICNDVTQAEAIILMGLPDGAESDDYLMILQAGLTKELPLYCSNPDLTSPRGGGTYVMSPGALAIMYSDLGGTVHLFGKPHLPIFTAMQAALACAPDKILMVGDSLHHDIKGAHDAGWANLLIEAGVHAPNIGKDRITDITRLAADAHTAPPTYSIPDLR